MPLYEYSDYLQVGEAYPWIRLPATSYTVTLTNFDGLSLSGNYQIGRWELHPRFVFGNDNFSTAYDNRTLTIHAANVAGAAAETVYDEWLWLRASYFHHQ